MSHPLNPIVRTLRLIREENERIAREILAAARGRRCGGCGDYRTNGVSAWCARFVNIWDDPLVLARGRLSVACARWEALGVARARMQMALALLEERATERKPVRPRRVLVRPPVREQLAFPVAAR